MNRSSAHSPRSFGCLIFIPWFFTDIPTAGCPTLFAFYVKGWERRCLTRLRTLIPT
jgi:hypothetical protein